MVPGRVSLLLTELMGGSPEVQWIQERGSQVLTRKTPLPLQFLNLKHLSN